MKDVVHIIGHKNPDTDSIVSAIAYAQLKQKLGINAIACRLGELNPETDFVLKKFQVPEPVYIQNARVKLYDVPFDEPLLLKKDDTIKEAWDRMGMRSTSALFVVDEAQKLLNEHVTGLTDRGITDWGKIKTEIKDSLGEFVWKKTKRRPMIIPIIMEV